MMNEELDPTQRFSDRAANYARYRPGYPHAILAVLRDEHGLAPHMAIADIGSGTGILTELFLRNGNQVFAVEPNEAMRQQAEVRLSDYPNFISVPGKAEATTLADHSVQLVTAGQAFHWFDATAARVEFQRILSAGGLVALVWNARAYENNALMAAYEQVLHDFGMGYHTVRHRSHEGDLALLYQEGYTFRQFTQTRELDFDTFWGGFLSASYAPLPGEPKYVPVQQALRSVFETYRQGDHVTFLYDTHLYVGRIT
jgi:ubiquinone/menaquinone biosynthesis C-methylase UbiE